MWKAFVFGAIAAAGAALADFLYALGAFPLGAILLPFVAGHRAAIDAGCALLLVAFGGWMLFTQFRPGRPSEAPQAARQLFLPTFLLTFPNPMTLVIFAGFVPRLPVAGSLAMAGLLALALGAGSAAAAVGILGFGLYGLAAAKQEGTVPLAAEPAKATVP